jgi:hypothetical protein
MQPQHPDDIVGSNSDLNKGGAFYQLGVYLGLTSSHLRACLYHNRIPVVFFDMAYAASFFCAICSIILVTVLVMLSSSFGVRSCFLLVGMGCSV